MVRGQAFYRTIDKSFNGRVILSAGCGASNILQSDKCGFARSVQLGIITIVSAATTAAFKE
jgi:hypothetical protein